jgi:hypothetical protein
LGRYCHECLAGIGLSSWRMVMSKQSCNAGSQTLAMRFAVLLLVAGLLAGAQRAAAAPPSTIHYQGALTQSGTPVSGSHILTFRLYATASGGSAIWSETQFGVPVANGLFNVQLGSVTAFGLAFDQPYFLSVQFNSDAEMSPRQPLVSAPYALRAVNAEQLSSAATISTSQLTGTLASAQLGSTQLLPVIACTSGQVPQWSGSAWACAAPLAGPQGPAGATGAQGAQGPSGPAGPPGPNTITGNLTLPDSTASVGNILKDAAPFIHNFGMSQTFVGVNAGNLSMTGSSNTGVGNGTLSANTNGTNNTALGVSALSGNLTGSANTALGSAALANAQGGEFNVAVGSGAGIDAAGSYNALLGTNSGASITGMQNTGVGGGALSQLTTGNGNIALGYGAGNAYTVGNTNIAIGNSGQAADSGVIRIGNFLQSKAYLAGVRDVSTDVADGLPVVIASNGQVGTGMASAGGTVTSVATGPGLTGGPITMSGTLALASSQLLPTTVCSTNQIAKWSGSAWVCAADADTNSGGTVTSITASGGLGTLVGAVVVPGGTLTSSGTIVLDPTSAVLTNNYFKIGGNTFGATAVLGSNNAVPVDIVSNGARAARFEHDANGANITLGHAANVAGGAGVYAATVGGGGTNALPNRATAISAMVGGGFGNLASGFSSGVGSGNFNTASNEYAVVAGGFQNTASGQRATIGGGGGNAASSLNATVAGGNSNSASGSGAAVGGGGFNTASGAGATVSGGSQNTASGAFTTVPGGANNLAAGAYSFAAGYKARANNDGCFVWSDAAADDFTCNVDHAFFVRSSGGVKFFSNSVLTTGCSISAGGGAWSCTSSREAKTDFDPLDGVDVLKRIAALPMASWRYKTEESKARHIGPMAEDFRAAFGLGDSDKSINVFDASGVALAAIQGLHTLVKEKDNEIAALKRDLMAIKKKLGLE